jgi:NaMN:DMB phosphoribosyltransferase
MYPDMDFIVDRVLHRTAAQVCDDARSHKHRLQHSHQPPPLLSVSEAQPADTTDAACVSVALTTSASVGLRR